MSEILITQEIADKATEAAVDALMGEFLPALLKAGVTRNQIQTALDSLKAESDNAWEGERLQPKGQNQDRQCHQTGMIGEGRFIAWASAQGWDLYRGLDGHTRFDYVVDMNGELKRVEIKRMESEQRSERNYYYVTATKLDTSKFDYLLQAPQWAIILFLLMFARVQHWL